MSSLLPEGVIEASHPDNNRVRSKYTAGGQAAALTDDLPILTRAEARVLELVAVGLSTQQIAERLHVSRQAITYHIGNLLGRFGCENRTGLVARAYFLNVLMPTPWPPIVHHNAKLPA